MVYKKISDLTNRAGLKPKVVPVGRWENSIIRRIDRRRDRDLLQMFLRSYFFAGFNINERR